MNRTQLAGLIDQAVLEAGLASGEVERRCREAAKAGLGAVCLHPVQVKLAAGILKGSRTKLCGVIAFPHGATTVLGKVFEALEACKHGAVELDVVLNLSAVASGERGAVEEEVRSLMDKTPDCRHKFIIETGMFRREELRPVLRIMNQRRPAFVKTSTGVNARGAIPDDVAYLRSELHPSIGIKAAGGIRSLEQVEALVAAGATRIGTSAGLDLLRQLDDRQLR
jgi:deoxyribose-phosphate aldolase